MTLTLANVEVVYSDVVVGLRGVSLTVPPGAIVALLGANGAGKTTCLRAISGLLDVHRGKITKGAISFEGERIDHADATDIVRRGVAQVLEGRRIFPELTVDENLRAGTYGHRNGATRRPYDRVMTLFPPLAERRSSIHPVPSFLGLCGPRGCTGEFLGFLAHILWINFTGSSTLRNPGERAPERFQGLQGTDLLIEPLAFLIVALRACHARRRTRRSPLRAPPVQMNAGAATRAEESCDARCSRRPRSGRARCWSPRGVRRPRQRSCRRR